MRKRLSAILDDIREKGNYRTIRHIKPVSAARLIFQGKECLNLCSNSYLSLHVHPDVIEAACRATREYGAGICSSRSVSGSLDLHETLEKEISAYKGYPERAHLFQRIHGEHRDHLHAHQSGRCDLQRRTESFEPDTQHEAFPGKKGSIPAP